MSSDDIDDPTPDQGLLTGSILERDAAIDEIILLAEINALEWATLKEWMAGLIRRLHVVHRQELELERNKA